MFYNAMQRKGWSPREEDMRSVVAIHNAVNEQTWREVLKWERLHQAECGQPRLVRFQGRPTDYSPKARLRSLVGYQLPFDRHDWVVDRCGKQVALAAQLPPPPPLTLFYAHPPRSSSAAKRRRSGAAPGARHRPDPAGRSSQTAHAAPGRRCGT